VFLEPLGQDIHPASRNAINTALGLAGDTKRELCGVLLTAAFGAGQSAVLERSGLTAVYVFVNSLLGNFVLEEHLEVLLAFVKEKKPGVILFGATPESRALAPALAARLKTGVTADCTKVAFREDGLLLQTRPAFGGDVTAEIITPWARPQIATLRGLAPELPRRGPAGSKIIVNSAKIVNPRAQKAEWLDRVTEAAENAASNVLAIGGGVRRQEDVEIFRRLAGRLKAELMCSRALVERGWFTRQSQIGLSGRGVRAEALLAMGVSGSVQFMAGVMSGRICAVNLDKDAPIMLKADVPIAGDLYAVADALLRCV
jgi:electron transfer flavoprotein alpha subunit